MAVTILMPKLGLTMTAGAVALWISEEGQLVSVGEIIVEIVTEKITYQMEAPASGTLLKIVVVEGEEVPVGTVIGVIGEPDEDITGLLGGTAVPTPAGETPESPWRGAPTTGVTSGWTSPATPGADGIAIETATSGPPEVAAAVRGGGSTPPNARAHASPAARKLAAELGVDLAHVTGSGPGGRITTDDVQASAGGVAAAAAAAAEGARLPRRVLRTIPYTGVRRAIGEHMASSRNTSPTVTHHVRADVHELMEVLSRLNEGREQDDKISSTAAIVKAVAASIVAEPAINATLAGDQINVWEAIDIGVAVSLPEGLIVPVIEDANLKATDEIARELRDLARRARDGSLLPDEATGSTFTVTSLAGYGSVDWFTPIINQPEAAVLGVGRVSDEVVAVNRSIVVRHTLGLSLTFDHRIVDGAPAAAFLKVLLERLQDPEGILG